MKLSLFLLPFWYPFILKNKVNDSKPTKNIFMEKPFVVYKNLDKNYIIHTDICPHQGASLSKGFLDKNKVLCCPYHGFQFDNGHFCNIPNPADEKVKPFKSRTHLGTLQTNTEDDKLVFVSQYNTTIPPIFYPHEHYDKSFRSIEGSILIKTNYLSVCENLLDMLHISYVHSFGSRQTPLPSSISFENITEYHGKTTFYYQPNKNTISGQIGNVKEVKVENEYILPTNTVTRVFAGDVIKTIFTRSIPISENETILYWKLYRNFLVHPIFDSFLYFLMDKTLSEDVAILKDVYYKHREGEINTKYDKTILEFRSSIHKYLNKN